MPAEFKSCKDHQYRDPETNRCRNKPDYKRVRSANNQKAENHQVSRQVSRQVSSLVKIINTVIMLLTGVEINQTTRG